MAKYTPGPWSINSWPQGDATVRIGATGTPRVAEVPLRDVSINEQAANAILISAAPDLLEAAQELREAFMAGGGDETKGPKRKRLVDAGAALDAAIAKALGK